MSMTDDSPIRNRLRSVSSLDDVVRLLKTSSRIMVLTGAGVSNLIILLLLINYNIINYFLGVSFMWNTRFSQSQRSLCQISYRISRLA